MGKNRRALPVENKFHRQRRTIDGANLVSQLMENVRHAAFQTLHDLLKPAQRNALLALLQTMQRRGGKSELFENWTNVMSPRLLRRNEASCFSKVSRTRQCWLKAHSDCGINYLTVVCELRKLIIVCESHSMPHR